MGKVVPFKKPKLSEKHKGKALCQNGHHKWGIINEQKFDVKLGKLVTCYKCQRCGVTKNRLI